MLINGTNYSNSCGSAINQIEAAIAMKLVVSLIIGDSISGIPNADETICHVGKLQKYFGRLVLISEDDGPTVIDDSKILTMANASTGRILYQHPYYRPFAQSDLSFIDATEPTRRWDGTYLPFEVYHQQQRLRCFPSRPEAQRYIKTLTNHSFQLRAAK